MQTLAMVLLVGVLGCSVDGGTGGEARGGQICPDYVQLMLDPSSAVCTAIGACDALGNSIPRPDDAACSGACTALSEADCVATAGCRAGFLGDGDGARGFFACWSTAPSGPVSSGACAGLDAHECSRHDNCVSFYTQIDTTAFEQCADEVPAK